MRVVAYSIKSFEKEPLAIANNKKHEITLISNSLGLETVSYAEGKEAVIVFNEEDNVSALVINKLADLGVKFIATRSTDTTHIDTEAAALRSLKIANVPLASLSGLSERELPMALATETIINLDNWQQNRCLGDACVCSRSCDQAGSKVHIKGQPHQH
ncbi:lactate dehydrogenase [Pedobacter sp. KBW06]|uniref:lactate dehydrogenase n=1 Tax=Pedobacter sp. KBW06 TaxID=2153359 RepID=UPI000F5A7BC8|nr:lactate dehydrogenase [Pedobacter sp. KBW06]RQO74121.1 lactate dehydrogenase [Pedobacter sp. KBW06]